jgi:hypothetical protein
LIVEDEALDDLPFDDDDQDWDAAREWSRP